MGPFDDRPNTFPWPPVIYGVAILLSVFLQWAVPVGWLPHPFSAFLFAVGIVTIFLALALDLMAMKTLHAARTTIMPHRGSEHVVTAGPYRFTRNPIYLGNSLLMLGVALVSGIMWFIPLAFLAAWATTELAIKREEQHLTHRFGKKYRDYARKVRRWV